MCIFRSLVLCIFIFVGGVANSQGIEAGSWGGKVRAGPGMEYQQIGSLQNGDRVQLLENTGVMMNGYPWYRISFFGGRLGYKWGGILCGYGNSIGGTFGICERDNRQNVYQPAPAPLPVNGVREFPCSQENAMRSESSDVGAFISFEVRGENDETQFRIYWLDYNGYRVFYKHLFVGESHTQATFLTHPWVVTAPEPGGGEECMAVYLPGHNSRTIILQ